MLLDAHVDYAVEVALPGEVREAPGADEVAGGTARWEVPAGESVAVHVTGDMPQPWPPPELVWAIGGSVGGLVLAGLVVWWWRRRRSGRRGSARRVAS
ncbi:hypothetical protein ER308_17695 [Egibacter rhizosphaerae]|uniref:DUF916 domain-containing protein n=1 Tax=Egibacter rhizosphaerae TaxID=1670831 RepID=A0A411YJ10_9ACTN|nr:hypothetical protein ER308_17695 [Egibacter rhizosphaerae]